MTVENAGNLFQEVAAGLTVSFVAMSLGAAFGVASGRGPLPGILSAGCIALITSLIGGTKVQCSGPTAPMTTVSTLVVAGAAAKLTDFPDVDVNRYINLVFLLTGFCLIVTGLLQIGRLIKFVPKIVISGFMNGIAIQIWWGEAKKVYGLGDKQGKAYKGGYVLNTIVMLATFTIVFGLPKLLEALGKPHWKKFLPSTLIGIVFVTAVCIPLTALSHVTVGEPINEFSDVADLFSANFPNTWSTSLVMRALPDALNLTMLCYLDTLLTSLVMDQKVDEKYEPGQRWRKTNQTMELIAQGLGNGFCALFGGLPGAQATIRSVLILNEGARTQLAGCLVGVFVIVEMIALQSLIGMIPSAVFSGVLLKVGYDVLDWPPAWMYIKTKFMGKPHPGGANDVHVTHIDAMFVLGTTLVTVLVNLNVAVGGFTLLFWVARLAKGEAWLQDMKTTSELKEPLAVEGLPKEVA